MNLNNLKLSGALIKNLYPNVLIEETLSAPKLVQTPKKDLKKYLGDNKRNITVISSFETVTHIPDTELEFLTSVLSACQLSLGDIAYVNIHNFPDQSLGSLISELNPGVVLLFGVGTEEIELPVRFPQFQKQQVKNTTYLAAPRLEEIQKDKELKKQLWGCLKTIFKI